MGNSEERAAFLRSQDLAVAKGAQTDLPGDISHDWLGRSLKQLFDDIAKEPIPQRIMDKLKELESKD